MVVCITKDRMRKVHAIAKSRKEKVSETIEYIISEFIYQSDFNEFMRCYVRACIYDTENVSRSIPLTESTEKGIQQVYRFFHRKHVINAIIDCVLGGEKL